MDDTLIVQSTSVRVQEFIEGTVWRDLLAEIEMWEQSQRNELLQVSDLYQLGKIQGRLDAIGSFRVLPQNLLDAIKDQEVTCVKLSHKLNDESTEDEEMEYDSLD